VHLEDLDVDVSMILKRILKKCVVLSLSQRIVQVFEERSEIGWHDTLVNSWPDETRTACSERP
jgi:hypothetical protein